MTGKKTAGSGTQFKGSNVTSVAVDGVRDQGILIRPRIATLVGALPESIALINCRTAGQQRMGGSWAAIDVAMDQ